MVVVVDTNIFIKALFFNNEWCQRLLQYESEGTIKFVFNLAMQKELIAAITIQLLLNGATRNQIFKASNRIQDILWRSNRVLHNIKTEICAEDPSDSKFFDCAIESKAKYIISEDGHLLSSYIPFIKEKYNHTIEILSPYQFITKILLQTKLRFEEM